MPEARRQPVFETWKVKSLPYAVVYSQAVLEEIAALPRENDEGCAGVLLGTHEALEVRVTTFRKLASACGEELTEEARAEVRALLESISAGDNQNALEAVGWFRFRPSGRISLSPADARFHEECFPRNWQVALVLRSGEEEGVRAGYFLREVSGEIRARASHKEFEVVAPPGGEEAETGVPEAPVELFDFPAPTRPRLWWWVAAGLAVAVAGGWYYLGQFRRPVGMAAPFGLRLVEREGRLRAEWNASNSLLRTAGGATLHVRDGTPGTPESVEVELPLTPQLLANGNWPIVRRGAEVRVTLSVGAGTEQLEESARFIGRPAYRDQSAESAAVFLARDELSAEVEELRIELKQTLNGNEDLLRSVAEKREVLARLERPAARGPVPSGGGATAPVPAPADPQPALIAPEALASPRAVSEAKPPAGVPARDFPSRPPPQARQAPLPGTPASAEVLSAPGYRGPTSGRVIWTGYLSDNAVLRIEGKRASTGNLSAALPAARIRLTASPAELSSAGLLIYSANPRYARGDASEAPGPRNAWSRTQIRHDPRRAQQVAVVESPGPENNWSRVALRAQGAALSVVVLEWELLP